MNDKWLTIDQSRSKTENATIYNTFCDELPVIDGVALKGRRPEVPSSFQQQALGELHSKHMGIENNVLVCMGVYIPVVCLQ